MKLSWNVGELKSWNIGAAVIQGLLCALMIGWLVYRSTTVSNEPFSIYSGEFGGPEECNSFGTISIDALIGLLIAFTAITCGFHIFYSKSSRYTTMIDKGVNSFRWIEYAITATLMLFVVAVSSGVYETDSQILIPIAAMSCMAMGYVVEQNKGNRNVQWVATLVGWLLLAGAFVVIFRNFGRAASGTNGPPSWVWILVIGIVVMYLSFGLIQLWQLFKSPNYKNVERRYTQLSMLAKSFLVLVVFSGLVAQSSGVSETATITSTESETATSTP